MTVMVWLTLLVLLLCVPSGNQSSQIDIIDFYGLRSTSEQQARQALQFKEGDSLSEYPKEAQRRLETLPGVVEARFRFICCEAGKNTLYVGIREKGSPSLRFRSAPVGKVRLPDDILQAGEAFGKAQTEAVQKGDAIEDLSRGHALSHNPAVRAIQERFITFAARDLKRLRDVLRNSNDADQRALAAQVIAYTANKQAVVGDLIEGMQDPSEEVRNNSTRALWVIAEFAQRAPEQRLRIPPEPFIKMLNSIEWLDRNKASMALAALTVKRDPVILSQLRKRALASLVEMARWKVQGHARPAFFLLGRVGGIPEDEIQRAWASGDREALIAAALKGVR